MISALLCVYFCCVVFRGVQLKHQFPEIFSLYKFKEVDTHLADSLCDRVFT